MKFDENEIKELLGKTPYEVLPPDDYCKILESQSEVISNQTLNMNGYTNIVSGNKVYVFGPK